MSEMVYREAVKLMERSEHFRVVVFGASNTERYMCSLHWSDVLEVGLRTRFGRKFQLVNSGISGNNTREALERFDRDVAFFKPALVIVTFGGNDCNPTPPKHVSEEEFSRNLDEIVSRIRALGALPVLQTYYKMDLAQMDPARAAGFVRNMELVREAAARNRVHPVDQYRLFDRIDLLTLRHKLLLNPMHVNEFGNTLIGVELLRHFDVDARLIPHHEKLLPALELLENSERA